MKSAKDIERSLRQAELDVEVNAKADRVVLDELAEVQRRSTSSPRAAWRILPRSSGLRLAATVAIATAIALLATRHGPSEPGPSAAGRRIASALELATAVSLEKAFRQGGIEAVENQYRRAFGTTPRNMETPSVEELLTDLETEMEDQRGENL